METPDAIFPKTPIRFVGALLDWEKIGLKGILLGVVKRVSHGTAVLVPLCQ